MPEQIISASGTQYGMLINADGSINVSGLDISIGSLALSLENVYVTSGTVYVVSGPPLMSNSRDILIANGSVGMNITNSYNTSAIQLTGAWTGQVEFEASIDGSNYFAHDFLNSVTHQIVNATAGNGYFYAGLAGFNSVRARASTLTAGSVQVVMNLSEGLQSVHLESSIPTGANTIGSVLATISGNVAIIEQVPTNSNKNNARTFIVYSGTVIGSIYKYIGTGSYVQSLSYTGANLTGISSWSVA